MRHGFAFGPYSAPIVIPATPLISLTTLRATFVSGQSALGHHWDLFGADEAKVGRTKRRYEGVGGKLGKRLAVATGLSTAGSVTIAILDGDGEELAILSGKGGERTKAALAWPDERPIGSAVHTPDVGVELLDHDGRVVGRIDTPADPDGETPPFAMFDAAGTQIGSLARGLHVVALPSAVEGVLEAIDWTVSTSQKAYEAELTRHRGFRSSPHYTVALDPEARLSEPLRTLAILSPVLAAYLY